jgi:hypothetical protein
MIMKARSHSSRLRLLLGAFKLLTVGLGRASRTMNTGSAKPTKGRLGEIGKSCKNDHASLVLIPVRTIQYSIGPRVCSGMRGSGVSHIPEKGRWTRVLRRIGMT